MQGVRIETPRFILRSLTEDDVSERYLNWLLDADTGRYIVSARKSLCLDDLREYVAERLPRVDALFLGIFLRDSMAHIGNIKYEPINRDQGYAVMGLLIGERHWQGRGVAGEVLKATVSWLAREAKIERIYLGVDQANKSAIKAYQKFGFGFLDKDDLGIATKTNFAMVFRTDQCRS